MGQLGARVRDAEVGTKIGVMYYGTEVPATSTPPRISARHFGAKICGAKTCYLGARTHGADPRSKDEFKSLREQI